MKVPVLKTPTKYKFLTILFALTLTVCQDTGNDADDDESPPDENIFETEITEAGGDFFITDGNNNNITITFPEGAVKEPTLVSVTLLSDRDDFPIETRHTVAFEIKPQDLLIYRPVSVFINFAQPITEVETALIFRLNQDQLLVPLADHVRFDSQGDRGQTIRAFTKMAGVFAEGTMSPEQVEYHMTALLNALDIKLAKPIAVPFDDPCDTKLNKRIWDTWKEYGDGAEELSYLVALMYLGIDLPDNGLEWNICANFLKSFADVILDKCVPENICDYSYQYMINEALAEMQKCGDFDNEYLQLFYNRWAEIQKSCIEEGTLEFNLYGHVVLENTGGPETPQRVNMRYKSEGGNAPLKLTIINTAGVAEIDDRQTIVGAVPLYPLYGSGSIIYFPGTENQRECAVYANGFLHVDLAGLKDSNENYKISIVTSHYHDRRIVCPDLPDENSPLNHERSRIFNVELNSENDFKQTVTSIGDTSWTINVELKLPK
jgi:hypothetical protein